VTVRIRINQSQVNQLFDANGPVARDMTRRATNVQLAARGQVRVRSGRLRRNIVKRGPAPNSQGGQTVEVGAYNLDYALLHHEGTRAHTIVPVNAKVLHFKVGGVDVFVRRVEHPGTAPNHYLTDNLKEALR
jgi:hypothetical protein